MRQVNIHEAKTHFSELIAAVERGEEIVIARRGKPVARIRPAEGDGAQKHKPRFGFLKEQVRVHPSFFDPMTDDELDEWYAPLEGAEELSPGTRTSERRRPA